MKKRPMEILAGGCVLGELFRMADVPWWLWLLLPACAAGVVLLCRRRREFPVLGVLVFLTFFVLGSLRMGMYVEAVNRETGLSDGDAQITGTVKEVTDRDGGCRVLLGETLITQQSEDGGTVSVSGAGNWYLYVTGTCTLHPGNTVQIAGELSFPEPARNEGEFDYRTYLQAIGIEGSIFPDEISVLSDRENVLACAILRLRRQCLASLMSAPEEDRGLLAAILLGNRNGLEDEEYDRFSRAGAGHILSISSLHLSILCLALYKVLSAVGTPVPLRAGLPIVLVWFYAVFAGSSPSAIRAALMFTMLMGGVIVGRTYDRKTGIAWALTVMLMISPGYLFLTGVQYSFAALIGIGVIAPVFETAMVPLPERARMGLAGYLGVFFAILPLQCFYQYGFSPYSVLLNGTLIPLMGILLGTGLGATAAGILSSAVGSLGFCIPHLILSLYRVIVSLPEQLPGGWILTGKPCTAGLIFYGITLLMVLFLARRRKRPGCLVLLAVLPLFLIRPTTAELTVNVIDVGQGSCTVIESESGEVMMIDCGSTDRDELYDRVISPWLSAHRIGKIDYLAATHMDTDHVSGIRELLEDGFPVGELLVTDRAEETEDSEEFLAEAEAAGVTAIRASAGTVITMGEETFTCLAPGADAVKEDENDYSLVFLLERGEFKALFTGDLGSEEEQKLLNSVPDVTLLLAGHHGSRNSSCAEFLAAVRPELALISCGQGNSYGHPHEETLGRLAAAGASVRRTDRGGGITVTVDGEAVRVRQYREDESDSR